LRFTRTPAIAVAFHLHPIAERIQRIVEKVRCPLLLSAFGGVAGGLFRRERSSGRLLRLGLPLNGSALLLLEIGQLAVRSLALRCREVCAFFLERRAFVSEALTLLLQLLSLSGGIALRGAALQLAQFTQATLRRLIVGARTAIATHGDSEQERKKEEAGFHQR
jgi:hypothetical protein